MSEHVHSISIVVEIDTNKRTIKETFDSFGDFYDWAVENGYLEAPTAVAFCDCDKYTLDKDGRCTHCGRSVR